MVGVLAGISVHPVWLGLVVAYLLGYVPTTGSFLGISFPPFSSSRPGLLRGFSPPARGRCGGSGVDWHLLLPWFVLAILYAAFYVRLIRSTTMEALNEDYVRTARAKGAPVLISFAISRVFLP